MLRFFSLFLSLLFFLLSSAQICSSIDLFCWPLIADCIHFPFLVFSVDSIALVFAQLMRVARGTEVVSVLYPVEVDVFPIRCSLYVRFDHVVSGLFSLSLSLSSPLFLFFLP